MEHGVRVDAVVASVTSPVGIHPTFVVALLIKKVIEVEGHNKRLALEESLRNLTVPYQLVGVRRRVVIASATVLVQIGRDFEALGQTQHHLSAVAEPPSVKICRWLQFVTRMLVVHIAVNRHLQPVVTETEVQALVQVRGARGVLLSVSLALCHIADIIIIAQARVGTHIPMSCAVEGGVERETTISVPVSVDILGTRSASTRLGVVSHKVGNGVADMTVVSVEDNAALVFADVVLIINIQRIGELRLQARVSLRDVERVGVVGDIQQLGDVRLTSVATIVEPDVVLVGELVVEVDSRCQVGDVTDGVHVDTTIILNEIGVLRLHKKSHVIVILLLPMTQGKAYIVRVIFIFGVAAEVAVEIAVHRVVDRGEPSVPLTIFGVDA